jgi:restriction endonuclease S subunit
MKKLKFSEIFKSIKIPKKIKKSEYLNEGLIPVISQEKNIINGYTNDNDSLINISENVIIFGDHTRCFKLIKHNFAVGADGVKILKVNSMNHKLDTSFMYYYLKFKKPISRGYARHFKHLKSINFLIPDYSSQQRIVKKLDTCMEQIDKAIQNVEKNIQNAEELFQSQLNEIFSRKDDKWKKINLVNLCLKIFAGGDKPDDISKQKTEKYNVPIFSNGKKNKGLYGYTNVQKVNEPSITISARGTIGYTQIREESFYPIVRLIVLVPNRDIIDINFLYYLLSGLDISNTGSSIPQLTVPMIKKYSFYVPDLSVQVKLVNNFHCLRNNLDNIKSKYKKEQDALNELKKSILEKAFNGEL